MKGHIKAIENFTYENRIKEILYHNSKVCSDHFSIPIFREEERSAFCS